MKVLFLGSGAVVTEFYLPAIAWLGSTWSATVADLSKSALKRAKSLAPWIDIMETDFEHALAASGHFDFVVVALPNWLHVPACKLAIANRLPVLCEKPLSLSVADCDVLADLAEGSGVPLEVAMVRRLIAANQVACSVVRSGVLGTISSVHIQHGAPYSWVSDSGAFFKKENGGILADLGIHHLDWLYSVLGDLEPTAYHDDSMGGVEASCQFELKSTAGVKIDLVLTHRHNLVNTTVICGDSGCLTLDRSVFDSARISGLVANTQMTVRCERPFDAPSLPHTFESCFIQQLLDFEKVVRRLKDVRVSARESAKATRLIEWAYSHRKVPKVHSLSTLKCADNGTSLERGNTVVTGGTGFIGGHLLERLALAGFDSIKVPVRSFRTCANAARFPVQLMPTDLCDRSQLRKILSGTRWVFHLAYGQTESDAGKITVDATKLLVEEAVEAGVEAVVVLSTMGVFGHPKTNQLVDETFGYLPAYGSYGKTKAQMEQWLLDSNRSFGRTRVVVLNPTCVYGPYGKTYARLPFELASNGGFAWIEGGSGIANYVYIDNLIDAILYVAQSPQADRQRFLVTDGDCSWRTFLTPMLGNLADEVPDFTLDQLLKVAAVTSRSSSSDLLRVVVKNPDFRKAISEHRFLGPIKTIVSKIASKRRSSTSTLSQRNDVFTEKKVVPPYWLADLFGPTTARFTSKKLKQLGWQPRIELAVGQLLTVQWLQATMPGFTTLETS